MLVAMEPYRPAFTVVTLGLLASGFYVTYGRRKAANCDCERPRAGRTGRWMLWVATGVASLALLSPSILAATSLAADSIGPLTESKGPLAVAALHVEGMTCPSCEGTIQAAVGRRAGVGSVAVRFADGSATVQYDPARVSAGELADAITELGYPTSVQVPAGG